MSTQEACMSWLDCLFGSALHPETGDRSEPVRPDSDFLDFEKRYFSVDPSLINITEVSAIYLNVSKRTPHDLYLSAAVAALSRISPEQLHALQVHTVTLAKSQLLKTEVTDPQPPGYFGKTSTLAHLLFHLQQQRPAFLSQLLAAGGGRRPPRRFMWDLSWNCHSCCAQGHAAWCASNSASSFERGLAADIVNAVEHAIGLRVSNCRSVI